MRYPVVGVEFLEFAQQAWSHHVEWESLRGVLRVDSEFLATFDAHQGAIVERFVLWEAFEGFELSLAHSLCLEMLAAKVILVSYLYLILRAGGAG